MIFLHRNDLNNVGDVYSCPARYFPFKSTKVFDILSISENSFKEDLIIVGGGGLGSDYFRQYLEKLAQKNRSYKLIAWGVGVDTYVDRSGSSILTPDEDYNLYGDYFDNFDEVGIRVYSNNQRFRFVPCASCMHEAFDKYRDTRPTRHIGYYSHHATPLQGVDSRKQVPIEDNSGSNLVSKLEFLSGCEIIVTNTYHGVYWATILNRKVICIPFKSGCFSFKYRPTYIDGLVTDEAKETAVSYPDSLEESRWLNTRYYNTLFNKYGEN